VNHTKRGELVYEPFLGSGTTLMAAEMTGRVCCGLDLDPKYVDVIIGRWQQLTGKQARLDGQSATFQDIEVQRRRGAQETAQEDPSPPSQSTAPTPAPKRKGNR
jgi:hypothetical protein